jgi:RNA polymerase sigma-70 factor (ECF subfamily)
MHFELQEIIQRVKTGDKEAFRKLVEHFQQSAFRFAFRMLGSEEEARDVVQDCFIRIWEKIDTYKQDENFTSWMYKIIHNRAIDTYRSKKRRAHISIDQVNPQLLNPVEGNLQVDLENKEAGELITLLTRDLPEKQRIIFTLRDLQGLSTKEVEEITGLDYTTIKSNLYHARKSIGKMFKSITNYEMK